MLNTKGNIVAIEIKDLTNADMFLHLLDDKNIPVIGACECIDVNNEYRMNPTCGHNRDHIVLVLKRHHEMALELLRSIEECFPILY